MNLRPIPAARQKAMDDAQKQMNRAQRAVTLAKAQTDKAEAQYQRAREAVMAATYGDFEMQIRYAYGLLPEVVGYISYDDAFEFFDADSLSAAADIIRGKITPAMLADGAWAVVRDEATMESIEIGGCKAHHEEMAADAAAEKHYADKERVARGWASEATR